MHQQAGVDDAPTRKPDSGVLIAIAMGVMNVATYGFQILSSRALGPVSFGAFAAVMNLLLVVGVGQLALQATAARRISASPGDVAGIERSVLRLTYRGSALLGLALLALAPVVNVLLRLDDLRTAALVGLTVVPMTIMGGQAGVLQGERRWRALAVLYVAAGVPRLVIGGVLVTVEPSEVSALTAVLVGSFAPVAVGAYALRRPRAAGGTTSGAEAGTRVLLAEIGRNSQALLAFVALCNVDLIVARNVLDEHDAGQYAAGLILTKAVLFLPQFVVVVAFPAMSTAHERRRALLRGLGAIAACGVVAVVGALVASPLALVFVGGDDYREIQDRLWLYAVLGLLLTLIQLLIYAVLATEGTRVAWLPWVALALLVVAGLRADDGLALVLTVISVDAVLLALLLVLGLRAPASAAPTETTSEPASP